MANTSWTPATGLNNTPDIVAKPELIGKVNPIGTSTVANPANVSTALTGASTVGIPKAIGTANSTAGNIANPNNIGTALTGASTIANPTNIDTSTSLGAASTAQERSINNNELTSYNVNQLINQNSPLMQQAAARSKQAMNASGLLNSSMAVGAAQGAVMDKAIDIGSRDATSQTNVLDRNLANRQQSNTQNADLLQNNRQFNASATNNTNQFNSTNDANAAIRNAELLSRANDTNAAATNNTNQFNTTNDVNAATRNAEFSQNNNQFNATANNNTNQFNSTNALNAATTNAGLLSRANDTNAAALNATNQYNANNDIRSNEVNANATNATNQFNTEQAVKVRAADVAETNKIISQIADINVKKQLADIEAQYKTIMQSSASAQQMYNQSAKNISEIMMNPDLTGAAKQEAVNTQNKLLTTGMNIIGKFSNINLDQLLTFPTVSGTAVKAA